MTQANKFWNQHSTHVQHWCLVYQDRDTDEVIKVKAETITNDLPGYFELRGNRDHPSLVNRRLRYLGVGTVLVSGFETSKTVPEFSYAKT